jgi:CubicO group peptidase (beta-lactamase class C family)
MLPCSWRRSRSLSRDSHQRACPWMEPCGRSTSLVCGISVIDGGQVAWTRIVGEHPPEALFQAASISKFVTAVAVMRLVEQGRLDLDLGVNTYLKSWRLPDSPQATEVTLRRLLSMTAGVSVPGYLGYAPGTPLPTLPEILNGSPPANSQPVTVTAFPGTAFAYSGGDMRSSRPSFRTYRRAIRGSNGTARP